MKKIIETHGGKHLREIRVKSFYKRIARFHRLLKIESDWSGMFSGKYHGYKTNGVGVINFYIYLD